MTFPPVGDEPAPLLISTTGSASGPRLAVAGELDIATAPQLLDAVAALAGRPPAADGERVDLDLADLTFLDASGLDALLAAQELARAGGRRLRIVGARPFARVLLEITGLVAVLEVGPAPVPVVAQGARGEAREEAARPERDLGIL